MAAAATLLVWAPRPAACAVPSAARPGSSAPSLPLHMSTSRRRPCCSRRRQGLAPPPRAAAEEEEPTEAADDEEEELDILQLDIEGEEQQPR